MVGNKVLKITPEELKQIKSTYERTEEEINEDVEKIKEWLKKQPHLPQDEDDFRIRMMLTLNKFSLEKTKHKLDYFYSFRNIVPDILTNRDSTSPAFITLMDNAILMPLPNLTPECHRVYISGYITTDASKFDLVIFLKIIYASFDLRMMYDLSLGDHFIIDFKNAKLGHLIQFTPVLIKKTYTILEKAYSDQVKGVHFINLPSAAAPVVTMFTSILSEKIANRVFVHKDFNSLHQKISKSILPVEYEGTAGRMDQMYEEWKIFYNSKNEWLKDLENRKSDESRRIGKPIDSDLFGMCGSFRKLNVD